MSSETGFVPTAFPPLGSTRERPADAGTRARGHLLGYAAGRRQAEQEWAERRAVLEAEAQVIAAQRADDHAAALRAVASAAAAVRAATLPLLSDIGDMLAESAVELAEAIIGRELSDPLTAVTAAIERVLADENAAIVLELRLNPEDAALVAGHAELTGGLAIVADAAVGRGEATATLPDGILDAGIRSALYRARQILTDGGAE
ncbi:MAG: FliH/SctL family protein [Leifsonia sp.]